MPPLLEVAAEEGEAMTVTDADPACTQPARASEYRWNFGGRGWVCRYVSLLR